MKSNLFTQFCSKLTALLLVFNNKIVCSSGGLEEKHPCRANSTNSCVILCRKWNLQTENGVGALKEILEAEGKKFQNCSLILEGFTHASISWDEINPDDNPKIEHLKIVRSPLDINQLNLKIFKNLRKLTMQNTTTPSLRLEVFRQLPQLQTLCIKQQNSIKWVENNFFQNLPLEMIKIQGIHLNPTKMTQLLKNLTGEFEVLNVHKLNWSHNNSTNNLFTNVLISTVFNMSTTDSKAFTNRTIKKVYIKEDKIQKIQEKNFTEGNNIICDCEIKRLQGLGKYTQKIRIKCFNAVGKPFLHAGKVKGEFPNAYRTPPENSGALHECNSIPNSVKFFPILNDTSNVFAITKDEPEVLEITISNAIAIEGVFLWYGNYANTTSPKFKCLKILQPKFSIYVTPYANYLICLVSNYGKYFYCLPFKTKPLHENQPWLTNKSIPLSILCIFVVFLFSAVIGALILYLSVRKNPSLIRGSKRVIEVKRHDKAQVLIMPRGYECSQGDPSSVALLNPRLPLEPTLSCDTISTVSYVSAHQPTQLEILTYRLNRLKELFQRNNNLPPPVPRMPMQIAIPVNQRLPPDVDLLFEYEWYTITTTTTTEA